MEYLILSFLAGILTVLAPCVITLLPVILSGTLGDKNPLRPLVIAGSLGISVIIFTLLLKATTLLINIPQAFWASVSGILIIVFGFTMLFPALWEKFAIKSKLYKSEGLLNKSSQKKGLKGAVLLGASLGPVFTTCSPTYALILAVVLPNNLGIGLINLVAYAVGLTFILLVIGYSGQRVTNQFKFAVNPNGWFKRGLGAVLIITGLLIVTGYDKKIETSLLKSGYQGPTSIEASLIDGLKE